MIRQIALISLVLFCLIGTALGQSQPANTITIFDTSGTVQMNRPVSVARAFRQGDIPNFAQASVNGVAVTTQTDVKNRWADGSVKFAIVSFVVPSIPANGSVPVTFTNQASGNNTGFLTQSQMLAAGFNFDATIQMTGAVIRSISARAMLSAGNVRYWLQGPVVTAVIIEDRTTARSYDTDFGDGSKALHPIFEAWFYPQNNSVDLGYTIENTWASTTTSNSMRDETYSLVLQAGNTSPTTKFTQASFTHIGKSRWHKRFWVGTAPPTIRVDHNIRYGVQSGAIPNYDTNVVIDPAVITNYYSSWQTANQTIPGGASRIGNYDKALAAAGAHPWIGLMNTWDTLYLLTMDDRMLAAMLGNADLAGRIPIWLREADQLAGTGDFYDLPFSGSVSTFGRPISINARRKVTLEDLTIITCSGGIGTDKINTGTITDDGWNGYNLGLAHLPDFAYVPYLLTGRYYYLEQLQMEAAYAVGSKLGCDELPYNRQAEAGFFHNEIRGDAWGFRTTAYAAFISSDGTPEKAYFEDKLGNNIAEWEGQRDLPISNTSDQTYWNFGNQQNRDADGPSPLGVWADRNPAFVQAPLRTDGYLASAASPWEENFLLCAIGMAKQFGYPTDTLLRFMAKTRFHNLLDPASLKYLIEQYRIPAKLASTNNWIQTWADYTNSYSPIPSAWTSLDNAEHGYPFIALAALSFLSSYTVDGYSGQQAWTLYKAEKPVQSLFATESPKWAILPMTAVVSTTSPPNPPTNLTIQ